MTGTARSAALVARGEAALARSCRVRFIGEATAGTLADDAFALYLLVEEAFVLTASRAAGFLVSTHSTWAALMPQATTLWNLVTTQREYFAALRERWPAPPGAERVEQQAQALSGYVLDRMRLDGAPGVVTAMFAAETLYLRWCTPAAAAEADRAPDLQAWIDLHTSAAFGAQVAALAAEVDALDEGAVTDADLDRWFTGMLAAEDVFHDAVYHAGGR